MESLERLRKYANGPCVYKDQKRVLLEIAEAFEVEHAELLDKALGEQDDAIRHAREVAYSTGYEAGFDEGLASTDGWSADDWTDQHEDAMAERGWVKLPVDGEAPSKQLADWIERRGLVTGPLDANGELWHSGDMSDSNWGEIEGIAFENGRWLVSGHDTSAPWIPADSIRHHHEPTVEDVLEELLREYDRDDSELTNGEIIERFAAKLRLAGDE